MQLDKYSVFDKEILLYAFICEEIEISISNCNFLSDGYGMSYFGIEFEVQNMRVKYFFEKGYGAILINDQRIELIHTDFNELSVKKNIQIIKKIIM